MSRTQLRAYIELSSAMVFVGSFVVASKVITTGFPVFLAAMLRFAIASAILLPMLLKAEHGFPSLAKKDVGILFLREPLTLTRGLGMLIATLGIGVINSIGAAPLPGRHQIPCLGTYSCLEQS